MWWCRSGSILAQVKACSLMAPSHYLNPRWLIISGVLWHSHVQISVLRICTSKIADRVGANELTHWGWVTHICIAYLTIIASDNGLSPSQRQAIIWTNAGILLIRPLGTNFSEILIEIHTFSFKKIRLKMSSAKRWPFCLGLNVLKEIDIFVATKWLWYMDW